MKPKDALIKDGFPGVTAGRGRLSLAAKTRCAELAAQGWDIDGYSSTPAPVVKATKAVDKPEPVTPKPGLTPVEGSTAGRGNQKVVMDIPDERYPEADFKAYAGGKQIGMRTACNTCGNALTHNVCALPRVWVDFETEADVEFRRV